MLPGMTGILAGLGGLRVEVGTFDWDTGVNADFHTFTAHNPGFSSAVVASDILICILTFYDSGGSDTALTIDTWTVDGQTVVQAVNDQARATSFRGVAIGAVTGVAGSTFDVYVNLTSYADQMDDYGFQCFRIPALTSTTAKAAGGGGIIEVDETIAGTLFGIGVAGDNSTATSGTSMTLGGDTAVLAHNANGLMIGYKVSGFDNAEAGPAVVDMSEIARVYATYG